WFWPPPAWLASTISCQACPSGERPASMTLLTLATFASSPFRLVTAVTSAGVSGEPDVAATTGIGSRPAGPNGAARVAAVWRRARRLWQHPRPPGRPGPAPAGDPSGRERRARARQDARAGRGNRHLRVVRGSR